MGQYDLVAVLEAPNDETLAKIALAQSMLGVFRSTETMRAFTEGGNCKSRRCPSLKRMLPVQS